MRIGSRTFVYEHPPRISRASCPSSAPARRGPWYAFRRIPQDDLFGQKTWEMGESEMLRRCAARAMEMGGLAPEEAQALFCGDLNDQIIATGFAACALSVPLVGLYGACSTFVEAGRCWLRRSSAAASCKRALRRLQPLLHGGTPVSLPPGDGHAAPAVGPVDGHSGRLRAAHGGGWHGAARHRRHIGAHPSIIKIKDANHMGAAMAPGGGINHMRASDDTSGGG